MKNGSIELDTQIEFERYLVFLVDKFFLDNSIDKKTNWKDYFPSVFIVASNDSSKKSDINAIKMDELLNQKLYG